MNKWITNFVVQEFLFNQLAWIAKECRSESSKRNGSHKLLNIGVTFQIICSHADLDGYDPSVSTLIGTQRRIQCRRWRYEDLFWPRKLKCKHHNYTDFFMHDNSINREHGISRRKLWRKKNTRMWQMFHSGKSYYNFMKMILKMMKKANELVSSINSNA